MRPLLRTVSPWRPEETLRLAALLAVGAALMVAAWVAVAGRDEWESQIGWANASVAGAIVALYGGASWLVRARRVLLARRDTLLPTMNGGATADDAGADAAPPLIADPTGGRVHRDSCPAAAGRGWPALSPEAAPHRERCGICRS